MEQTPNRRKPAPKPNNALGSLLGSVVLGVCIIIAGSTVAGSVKKLTAAVEAQTFASSYASPSNLTEAALRTRSISPRPRLPLTSICLLRR